MRAHRGARGSVLNGTRSGGAAESIQNNLAAVLQQLQLLAQPRICLTRLHNTAAFLNVCRGLHESACLSQTCQPPNTASDAIYVNTCVSVGNKEALAG